MYGIITGSLSAFLSLSAIVIPIIKVKYYGYCNLFQGKKSEYYKIIQLKCKLYIRSMQQITTLSYQRTICILNAMQS